MVCLDAGLSDACVRSPPTLLIGTRVISVIHNMSLKVQVKFPIGKCLHADGFISSVELLVCWPNGSRTYGECVTAVGPLSICFPSCPPHSLFVCSLLYSHGNGFLHRIGALHCFGGSLSSQLWQWEVPSESRTSTRPVRCIVYFSTPFGIYWS